MIKAALNFDWTFKESFEPKDVEESIQGTQVDLPHTNQVLPRQYFSEQSYQMVSTYQKILHIQKQNGRRYHLFFEGVMSKAKVYINGHFLMEHVGGYTHFKVEITEHIQGGEDRLTVVVDAIEHPDHPPFGHVIDYLTYGGIYREVFLIETSIDAIDEVLIHGDEKALSIRVIPDAITDQTHEMTFVIKDHDQTIDRWTQQSNLTDTIHLTRPHQLKLWSVESPTLYTLEVQIDGVHAYETTFGIRTIKVTKDAFYLNGQKMFLRGLNRHQSYPYVGYAMPKRAQYEDAEILKHQLGVNIVRSSHYPPSRHFLDRCDQIGLLVFTELPGWQHVGDEAWKAHALDDLKSLVIKDYNHPSVVMIGTRINESQDDHDFYTKTRDLVKSIDTSRPTGGVRYFGKSELLEDIYTINDFIHKGDNPGISKKQAMTDAKNPYLITEYNGHMFPTKSFDSEKHRVEHAKRHFKVLNDAYQTQGLMGAIGWCMNDYNTHRDFGSNDHICHHGVLDMNRNPKYAAAAYASQQNTPFMEVLSMMHIGDLPQGELKEVLIATNMDQVKVYKNKIEIGVFDRTNTPYPSLPYPPIVVDDFIGRQIHDNEVFNEKDATRIKSIMLKTLKKGLKMSLGTKLMFGYLLFKYRLTYQDAVRLYTTYIGGWGDTAKVYRFEGIKDGQVIISQSKGYDDHYHIRAHLSTETLIIGDTYDVCRLVIELKNDIDERAFYTQAIANIQTSKEIEVIGPSVIALQGGIQTVWIKSLKPGQATIDIKSEYGEQRLTLNVLSER
jgi:beta-galactosidase